MCYFLECSDKDYLLSHLLGINASLDIRTFKSSLSQISSLHFLHSFSKAYSHLAKATPLSEESFNYMKSAFRLCLHVTFFSPFLLAVALIFFMYKHLHWILLNSFFNGLKNGLKNATCKCTLNDVKKIKGTASKNGLKNAMCKQTSSSGKSQ